MSRGYDGPEIDDSRKASAEISSRRPTRLLAVDINDRLSHSDEKR
jgi:hypothetical protein